MNRCLLEGIVLTGVDKEWSVELRTIAFRKFDVMNCDYSQLDCCSLSSHLVSECVASGFTVYTTAAVSQVQRQSYKCGGYKLN